MTRQGERLPPRWQCRSGWGRATARPTPDRSWCVTLDTGERQAGGWSPSSGRSARSWSRVEAASCWRSVARVRTFARWRLDGPGVGGSLLVPGRVATGGFDLTGRLLLVSRPQGAGSEVVDAPPAPLSYASVSRARPSGCQPTRSGCLVEGRSWSTSRRARCERRRSWVSPEALYPEPGGTHALGRHASWRCLQAAPRVPVDRQVTTAFTHRGAAAVRPSQTGPACSSRSKGPQENWGTSRYDVATGAFLDQGHRRNLGWRSPLITRS